MYRKKKPKKPENILLPTLLAIGIIAILISLFTWQLNKHQYKLSVSKNIKKMIVQNALFEYDALSTKTLTPLHYKPIKVEGKFLHHKEIYLYSVENSVSRSYKNNYQLFTPFQTKSGKIILIARGQLDVRYKNPKSRMNLNSQEEKNSTITGLVIPPHKKPLLSSFADLKNNIWYSLYIPEISKYLDLPVEDGYILPDAERNPHIFDNEIIIPIDDKTILTRIHNNNHLTYAITWGVLAICMAGTYCIYCVKRFSKEKVNQNDNDISHI